MDNKMSPAEMLTLMSQNSDQEIILTQRLEDIAIDIQSQNSLPVNS